MSNIDFEDAKKLFSEICYHLEYINNSLQEIKSVLGGKSFDEEKDDPVTTSLTRIAYELEKINDE